MVTMKTGWDYQRLCKKERRKFFDDVMAEHSLFRTRQWRRGDGGWEGGMRILLVVSWDEEEEARCPTTCVGRKLVSVQG